MKLPVLIPVLVLVLVLTLGLAEGTLLSKCGLKEKLDATISQLPERAKAKGLTKETLVAKIVCYVETMSGFNTSAVTVITPPEERNSSRGRRSLRRPPGPPGPPRPTHSSGTPGPPRPTRPTRPSGPLGPIRPTRPSGPPGPHRTSRPNRPSGPFGPIRPTRPQNPDGEVWTLFGVFQLSDHLVCSNGSTPSPNICQMDCDELLDDDIDDDISCLLQIFSNLVETGFGGPHWAELKKMMRLLYPDQCRNQQTSSYFDDCN